jgi:hypothetical protein
LPDTTAMNMQALPADLPAIVQPIDDWNRNLRLSMLFEARVGDGRLMVTSLDLSEAGVAAHPGGPSLRRSVLDYMASDRFAPGAALTFALLDDWMGSRYEAPGTVITPPATLDVVDPGQIRRRAPA